MDGKLSKEEIDHFENVSEKYLNEGINYSANTIKKLIRKTLNNLLQILLKLGGTRPEIFTRNPNQQ